MNKRSAMLMAAGLVLTLIVGGVAMSIGLTGPTSSEAAPRAGRARTAAPIVKTVKHTVTVHKRGHRHRRATGTGTSGSSSAGSVSGSTDDDHGSEQRRRPMARTTAITEATTRASHGDDHGDDDHGTTTMAMRRPWRRRPDGLMTEHRHAAKPKRWSKGRVRALAWVTGAATFLAGFGILGRGSEALRGERDRPLAQAEATTSADHRPQGDSARGGRGPRGHCAGDLRTDDVIRGRVLLRLHVVQRRNDHGRRRLRHPHRPRRVRRMDSRRPTLHRGTPSRRDSERWAPTCPSTGRTTTPSTRRSPRSGACSKPRSDGSPGSATTASSPP